jgi:integrase
MPTKPFYRAFDDWWYVQFCVGTKRVQKKLVKGKANEEEAYQAFYRLMVVGPELPPPITITTVKCCDLFLGWSEKHNEPATYVWYRGYLQTFCDLYGAVPALDLKPFHVTRWLDGRPGWKGSRRCAVTALKRAFNWCEDEGVLPANPLKRIKKPPQASRERVLTPAERETILTAIGDQPFREFVFALLETGRRPGEARTVTATQ